MKFSLEDHNNHARVHTLHGYRAISQTHLAAFVVMRAMRRHKSSYGRVYQNEPGRGGAEVGWVPAPSELIPRSGIFVNFITFDLAYLEHLCYSLAWE